MEISKFKLLNRGRGGIEINGIETIQLNNGVATADSVKRTRNLMISDDLVKKIQELKYYFFNLTGHWMPPFNKYYDREHHCLAEMEFDAEGRIKPGQEMLRNIWMRTDILGVSYKSGGFVITGMINTVGNKWVTINTPFVTEDDDLGFYNDAIDKIQEIIVEIVRFINSRYLPEYKPEDVFSKEELDGYKDLDVNELSKLVTDKMMEKGMIVLVSDEQPALQSDNMKVSRNTDNIDGDNLQFAEEHNEDPEELTPEQIAEIERIDNATRNKNASAGQYGIPSKPANVPDENIVSEDQLTPGTDEWQE